MFLIPFLVFLTGCEEKVEIQLPNNLKIAVTGELKAGQPAVLQLMELGNIGHSGSPRKLEHAEVSIQNMQTKEIFSCLPVADGYWRNDKFLPQSGHSYLLNVQTSNQKVNAIATIPNAFALTGERVDQNRTSITLTFPEANLMPLIISLQARSYHFEAGQIVYDSNWENINMDCKDEATDNLRYRELTAPYSKLFIPAHTTARKITFSPESRNGLRVFSVHVKSSETIYYKYIYDYEYLRNNSPAGNNGFITIQSNVNNGLGIFGGVNEQVLEF